MDKEKASMLFKEALEQVLNRLWVVLSADREPKPPRWTFWARGRAQ